MKRPGRIGGNGRGKEKGFTLIELLVVIAIIALLLSIIMPALRKVKDMAKIVLCKANVRSVSLTVNLYAEDHGGKMFPYNSGLFINELSAYTDDMDEIRFCPATDKLDEHELTTTYAGGRWGSSKDTWVWSSGLSEPEQGSFGLNGWIYYYPPGGNFDWINVDIEHYAFPSYVGITTPSSVPVFVDCVWVDLWPMDTDTIPSNYDITQEIRNTGSDGPPSVSNHIRRAIIDRHFGVVDLSFADGHVESSQLEDMWTHKWNLDFGPTSDKTRDDGSPIYR